MVTHGGDPEWREQSEKKNICPLLYPCGLTVYPRGSLQQQEEKVNRKLSVTGPGFWYDTHDWGDTPVFFSQTLRKAPRACLSSWRPLLSSTSSPQGHQLNPV